MVLCASLISIQTAAALEDEWKKLLNGNQEFVKDETVAKDRAGLVQGQNPGAVVLCCSDSRTAPEIVFHQGLGELFVVRTAGQVIDLVAVDSIEYAVGHFPNVSVIVVLGHTQCGAVTGAVDRLKKNKGKIDALNGHLNAVLIPIETAILQSKIDLAAPNAVELATAANVSYIANQLVAQSPPIARAIQNKKLKIIGAVYSLETGQVNQKVVID